MSAPVIALLVVAYLAIGAVLAGLMDRGAYPEDENGPLITALWPAFLATYALVGVVYVAHLPFRALYRIVKGAGR